MTRNGRTIAATLLLALPACLGPSAPAEIRGAREEEVALALGDGRERGGTLVRPPGPGRHPAVLLIGTPGRGRDHLARGWPVFRRLAAALAEAGVASLRLDDADAGARPEAAFERTPFERLEDARRAVAWLHEDPRIDPARVGVVGHGAGALLATWAAVHHPEVAFVVLLAPTTIPVEDALHARLDAGGRTDADAHRRLDELFHAVRVGHGEVAAARRTAFADELAPIATSPWLRVHLGLDPTPLLGRGRVPTLAVFAGEDRRAPAAVHAAALERALDRAGRPDVVVTILDGADHDFLPPGGDDPADAFAPGFEETVSGWLAAR